MSSRQGRYYGKFRGKVVDNLDPMQLGRLRVEAPSAAEGSLTWAMPCVPYAGAEVGFYAIPPIGANVCEFEEGRLEHPIWTGCFWAPGEMPMLGRPEMKVLETESCLLMLSDLPGEGGVTLEPINRA